MSLTKNRYWLRYNGVCSKLKVEEMKKALGVNLIHSSGDSSGGSFIFLALKNGLLGQFFISRGLVVGLSTLTGLFEIRVM